MKTILFRLNLKGNGIVNFDDKDQKWVFKESDKFKHLFHSYDNIKYSKKVFYKNDNDELCDFKIKISDKCLKKSIFNNDMIGQNTNFVQNKELLFSQIGSPYYILNGYMLTVNNGGLSYKKKSPITLLPAIQTNNCYPVLEVCTRSGYKKEKDDSKSDTTLFNIETIGDVTYKSSGSIDLKELQFISLDDYYDRWAFGSDEFNLFEKYFKLQVPSFNSKPCYYKLKYSQNSFPELGIKLSDDDVTTLIRYYFKRVIGLKILRNSAYAEFDSLEIKYVNDPMVDTYENPNGWINVKTVEDVDNINVKCDDFYIVQEEQESIELRKNLIPMDDVSEKKKNIKKNLNKE